MRPVVLIAHAGLELTVFCVSRFRHVPAPLIVDLFLYSSIPLLMSPFPSLFLF